VSKVSPLVRLAPVVAVAVTVMAPRYAVSVRAGIDATQTSASAAITAVFIGKLGVIWPEAEVEKSDLETVIVDLLDGQYKNPIGVIAFNTAEQWSRNVSEDVALELRRRCDLEGRELPEGVRTLSSATHATPAN
jgi:hypothetical protein